MAVCVRRQKAGQQKRDYRNGRFGRLANIHPYDTNLKQGGVVTMGDEFEGGCLCGTVRFVATGSAGCGDVVSLPKLSETQRRACVRLRGISTRGLCRYQR